MLNFRKIFSVGLVISLSSLILSSCSLDNEKTRNISTETKRRIALVSDCAGINDEAFNQGAWEGLLELEKEGKIQALVQESKNEGDFVSNFDKLADKKAELIFGAGFALERSIIEASNNNKKTNFVFIDSIPEKIPENVTAYSFRTQEASFLAGYIAAKSAQTGKIGFISGRSSSPIMDQFEYGYRGGAEYAAKEINKKIEVVSQCAESFEDVAKGKIIGAKMYQDGCSVVFHAAAATGKGLIEAAKEANKFAIGVDMDQSKLAPDNILTSVIKKVGKIIKLHTEEFLKGDRKGGKGIDLGLNEGCVGLPEINKNVDVKILESVKQIEEKIKKNEIKPPFDKKSFEEFIK